MGTPLVFGNSVGCVHFASLVMVEWKDNITSLPPVEERKCGILFVTVAGVVYSVALQTVLSQKQSSVSVQWTNGICLGTD